MDVDSLPGRALSREVATSRSSEAAERELDRFSEPEYHRLKRKLDPPNSRKKSA